MAQGERERLLMRRDTSQPRRTSGVQHSLHDQRGWLKIQMACACILATETFERIAFYAVSGNLVLFLNETPFVWESYNAAAASYFFLGLSYIMSLFSGWLADSYLGKFKMVLLSFIMYIAAYTFLPILSQTRENDKLPSMCGSPGLTNYTLGAVMYAPNYTYPVLSDDQLSQQADTLLQQEDAWSASDLSDARPWTNLDYSVAFRTLSEENCAWLVFLILFLLSLSVGSIKANLAPFGGEQVRNEGQENRRGFFNWFYWCTNLGAFIGLGPIAYVQQEQDFYYGYLAAGVCLFVAALLFALGGFCYTKRPAGGSNLSDLCRVFIAACRSQRHRAETFTIIDDDEPSPGFLDRAKLRYGGQYRDSIVDDVRSVVKIGCVFAALVPYWIVYFQMETTFLLQALHMRLSFTDTTTEHVQIAVAWLSLMDVIFLIILIPIMDRLVYPRLDNAGYHFSMTKRITVGMGFGIAAMLVAGGVETERLAIFWPNSTTPFVNASVPNHIGNDTYEAANMSVLWQIPQNCLLGASEVFASVAGLEFAYSKAPKSMKGIMMGLFFFFSGVGSLIGTGLMYAFNGTWFFGVDRGNINCRFHSMAEPDIIAKSCHLDYYFYFLAGIGFVGLCVFLLVVRLLKFGRDDVTPSVVPTKHRLSNDMITASASESESPESRDSNTYGSVNNR